jgi:hypothetical protein
MKSSSTAASSLIISSHRFGVFTVIRYISGLGDSERPIILHLLAQHRLKKLAYHAPLNVRDTTWIEAKLRLS